MKRFDNLKSKLMLFMILRKVKSRLKKSGLEKKEIKEISDKIKEVLG